MTVPNEMILVFALAILGIQSLALIYVVIRMVGVLDKTLARAQAPDTSAPATGQPVPAPGPVPPKPSGGSPAPAPEPTPPPSDVVIDQALVDFIKKQEGFQAKAYWDYKQYTNGYGTRANSSTEVIDQAEAERRIRVEIAAADKLVTDFAPGLPKGVHQALLDLTFNAGSGWEHQSLGAAVKAQKWDTVKADILQYTHAGGQVLEALVKRREAEVSWFDHPL